jgi:superfamily I DNA/RNA helicase
MKLISLIISLFSDKKTKEADSSILPRTEIPKTSEIPSNNIIVDTNPTTNAIVPLTEIDMAHHKAAFLNKIDEINLLEAKEKDGGQPVYISEEQKKVVFSKNRATPVVAGAGSGKTSTMILRVIFFHFFLGYELEEITVLTFTTESRKDFIKKLRKRSKQFGKELSEIQAKNVVRTFHSLAYKFNKKQNGLKKILFDFQESKPNEDDLEGVDIENMYELKNEKNNEPSETVRMQSALYNNLYITNDWFKNKVHELLLQNYKDSRLKQTVDSKYKYEINVEDEIFNIMERIWRKENDISDIFDKYIPKKIEDSSLKTNGVTLKNHLFLPKSKIRIFLSKSYSDIDKNIDISGIKIKGTRNLFKYIVGNRLRHVVNNNNNDYIVVHTIEELKLLIQYEESIENSEGLEKSFNFEFVSSGDFITEGGSYFLHDQFSKIIDFSYSIGQPLYELSADSIDSILDKKAPKSDVIFLKLACFFHKEWIKTLSNKELITFDEVFYQMSKNKSSEYSSIESSSFRNLTHLFIDEFQDISPLILKFLDRLKLIQNKNAQIKTGTLTCVGDDLQSIYGWRGSSSTFIKNFNTCFSLENNHLIKVLLLIDNYRSDVNILDKASIITDEIKNKIDKDYKAESKKEKNVEIGFYPSNKNTCDYKTAFELLKSTFESEEIDRQSPIFILGANHKSIRGSVPYEMQSYILEKEKEEKIKRITIHSSKGLESEIVFIFGDLISNKTNHIREALYKKADIGESYFEMQKDESLRLAYVAITRAKRKVYWFSRNSENKKNPINFMFQKNI